MKKLLAALILVAMLLPGTVRAGCPVDFIDGVAADIYFSFVKWNGTGEDTANTGNKRVAWGYLDAGTPTWCTNPTCSTTTTASEYLFTMTQFTGSQYYITLTPPTGQAGRYMSLRFDETDDVDVTLSVTCYVHAQDRWVTTDEVGTDSAALASNWTAARAGYVDNLSGGAVALAAALSTVDTEVGNLQADLDNATDGLGALKALIDALQADLDNGTDGLGALKTLIDALNDISVNDVWDEAQSGHTTAGTFGKYLDSEVSGAGGGAFISGTAEATSTTTTIVDTTNLTSSQANAYIGGVVEVDGELSIVKSFNPGTNTITLWTPLSAEPDTKTYTLTRDSLNELWQKIRSMRR